MRHRLQGRQVLLGVALTAVMVAALILSSGALLVGGVPEGRMAYPGLPFAHHAGSATVAVDSYLIWVSGISLLALLAFTLAATFFLNDLYRRTGAAEAFFLMSFVLSLVLEALRVVCAALVLGKVDTGLAVLSTRVVYMGRLFGLASLFSTTLYGLGMRYGDYGVLSGAGSLLALVMGAIVPVDTSSLTTGLIHAVSDGGGLLSVGAGGAAIVALCALSTPLVRQEPRAVGFGLGIVCLVLGRELYSLGWVPAFGLGLALLVAGGWLASRWLERSYLGIA